MLPYIKKKPNISNLDLKEALPNTKKIERQIQKRHAKLENYKNDSKQKRQFFNIQNVTPYKLERPKKKNHKKKLMHVKKIKLKKRPVKIKKNRLNSAYKVLFE